MKNIKDKQVYDKDKWLNLQEIFIIKDKINPKK